ncbi:MAG TPA: hypothetical protein VFQ88_03680 [Nevskiaceae bacterium]|nr:hypothetical protein [Nevskiaceae bacterium]
MKKFWVVVACCAIGLTTATNATADVNSVADAAGRTTQHVVKTVGDALQTAGSATVKGLKVGARATAHGVDRAAHATSHALDRAAAAVTPAGSSSTVGQVAPGH